jgi:hypothetical protein
LLPRISATSGARPKPLERSTCRVRKRLSRRTCGLPHRSVALKSPHVALSRRSTHAPHLAVIDVRLPRAVALRATAVRERALVDGAQRRDEVQQASTVASGGTTPAAALSGGGLQQRRDLLRVVVKVACRWTVACKGLAGDACFVTISGLRRPRKETRPCSKPRAGFPQGSWTFPPSFGC